MEKKPNIFLVGGGIASMANVNIKIPLIYHGLSDPKVGLQALESAFK